MHKKIDIRFLLYKVYNIHELVFNLHYENKNDEAYSLVLYEHKIYQYLNQHLKNNIKIDIHYLEYSSLITRKIKDIEHALDYFKKLNCNKKNISNETKKSWLKLQKNNLYYYFQNPKSLDYLSIKTLYYIFIFIVNELKKLDTSFNLSKEDTNYLNCFSPFISQNHS